MRDETPALLALEEEVGPPPEFPEPQPPASLAPESFAEHLYEMLAPLGQVDADNGWALLILCNAIGRMFQPVEELVRDTPAGPGWSVLMDADRAPAWALPWLAQFAGVRIPPGLDLEDARHWVASTDGFNRGTRDALIGAARATLTGDRTVVFRERDGPVGTGSPEYAYYLTVLTYRSETPDPDATRRALMAQKPGGIILDYRLADGQDFQLVRDRNATFQEVKDRYSDFLALMTDQPEMLPREGS